MSLLAKKSDLETKLAGVQAQLDIVKEAIARGETADVHGSISANIIQYLQRKPLGAQAKDIVTYVSAMTGANETSVRTRISTLVKKKKLIATDGQEPFTYRLT